MNIILNMLLFGFAGLAIGNKNFNQRIAGGEIATEKSFRFQGQLIVNGTFICGAVLISRKHLISTAHSVKFLTQHGMANLSKEILLGSRKIFRGTRFSIKRVSYHQGFDQKSNLFYPDDISVIHLYQSVPINKNYKPIKLPIEYEELPAGIKVIASGFGCQSQRWFLSKLLKKVQMEIEPLRHCQEIINDKVLTSSHMCTMPGKGIGCCDGDNGGPLVNENQTTIFGIISVISAECLKGAPTIYTKVSQYISYIQKEMMYSIEDPNTWTDHPEANFA